MRKYEAYAITTTPLENTLDDQAIFILTYISVNYNNISLKKTAEFFNYSESYVCRLIKEYTGITFSELIAKLQAEHGKDMLDKGEENIMMISQEVGCFGSSHFNKKFKKMYGMSPKEYKNSIKQKEKMSLN